MANTLLSGSVVRVAEDVENKLYNYNPSESPLVSSIARTPVYNTFHEWNRDSYATPDGTNAAIEGADASSAAITQPGPLNNRTQIFQKAYSISNTTEAVKKYGRKGNSELNRVKALRMVEIRRDMEAACIGSGAAVTGTGSVAGKLRGLYGFIATNDSLGTGGASPDPTDNTAPTAGTTRALTESLLQTVVLGVYNNGGNADTILCSPAHKQKISQSFTGDVTKYQDVGGKGQTTLNTNIDFYRHDFGTSKVVPNRVMAQGSGAGLVNTLYVLDFDKIALGQLRSMETEQLATTGDAKNYQMRTEVTLIVRDEKPLGAIRDLTATGS
jgi:hypothetical protein